MSAAKNKSVKKNKKLTFVLSPRYFSLLERYADEYNLGKADAIRSILKSTLRSFEKEHPLCTEDENQLNIFDSLQFDIFQNLSKTNMNEV